MPEPLAYVLEQILRLTPLRTVRISACLLAVSEGQNRSWYVIDTSLLNGHPDYVKEWFPDGFGGLKIPRDKEPYLVRGLPFF